MGFSLSEALNPAKISFSKIPYFYRNYDWMNNSEIKIYKAEDGKTEIQVKLDDDSVWLNLMQLTELFQRDKSVVSRHINNIFKEKELDLGATVANFATVQLEGGREVERNFEFFNLDVIISVGYRIKSQRGTQSRIWQTKC